MIESDEETPAEAAAREERGAEHRAAVDAAKERAKALARDAGATDEDRRLAFDAYWKLCGRHLSRGRPIQEPEPWEDPFHGCCD